MQKTVELTLPSKVWAASVYIRHIRQQGGDLPTQNTGMWKLIFKLNTAISLYWFVIDLHDTTSKSPERPHQWVCQLGGWYRGRCHTGRPAPGPGSPPTATSSWFWPKALQKVFYLDQVGNIEAQGEEEKSGTNKPEQCSTMFTEHGFLKNRNKNMNRV